MVKEREREENDGELISFVIAITTDTNGHLECELFV